MKRDDEKIQELWRREVKHFEPGAEEWLVARRRILSESDRRESAHNEKGYSFLSALLRPQILIPVAVAAFALFALVILPEKLETDGETAEIVLSSSNIGDDGDEMEEDWSYFGSSDELLYGEDISAKEWVYLSFLDDGLDFDGISQGADYSETLGALENVLSEYRKVKTQTNR